MTDKTPSFQECGVCAGWLGQWNDHNIHAKNCTLIADMEAAQHETAKKIKHLKSLLEETPTVKEVGERLIKEHKPLFDALAEERDAKKCTCHTVPVMPFPDIAIDPACPVHGDGAKKAPTCICENPNTYSGRNMNCPIHPFKRDAAPRDSLDEIKKCLGEYAEKYYLAAEENDPSPSIDYYTKRIQDWHITQVRELQQKLKSLDLKWESTGGQKRNLQPFFNSHIDQVFDRALERLEDTA